MAGTHFLKMLRSVFSFELSSVPLSEVEVDTIGAASVEAVEEVVDEAMEFLSLADGPDDEEAMIKWSLGDLQDRQLGGRAVGVRTRYGCQVRLPMAQ